MTGSLSAPAGPHMLAPSAPMRLSANASRRARMVALTMVVVVVVLGAVTGTARAALGYSPHTFATGAGPAQQVVTADFNGDGRPDLATAERTGQVSVLINSGLGGFDPAVVYPTGGTQAFFLAVGDVNGDGRPDLVVNNSGTGSVAVLTGRGDGTFNAAQLYPITAGFHQHTLALADVNGDGHPDIITPVQSNTLQHGILPSGFDVLLNQGDGSFGAPLFTSVPGDPDGVAVGDLNGDGHPDLALADPITSVLRVYVGDGSGAFTAAGTYDGGNGAVSVAIGDLNGDGRPDIAVADSTANQVAVFTGLGGGRFTTGATYRTGSSPEFVALADMNGDGRPDLLTANAGRASVSVLVNTGTGGFSPDIAADDVGGVVVLTASPLAATAIQGFGAVADHSETAGAYTTTVTNVSDQPVTITRSVISGPDASSFFVWQDHCTGIALAPGGSCTIGVRFHPIGTGTKSAQLDIIYPGTPVPWSLPVSGTGTAGAWLMLSPKKLYFGSHPVGASRSLIDTVTNVGSAAMSINTLTVGGDPTDYQILSSTCPGATLEAGMSCSITVQYTPSSATVTSALITIDDTAPRSPHLLRMTGTGTGGPGL
jgi:hypothetical protein